MATIVPVNSDEHVDGEAGVTQNDPPPVAVPVPTTIDASAAAATVRVSTEIRKPTDEKLIDIQADSFGGQSPIVTDVLMGDSNVKSKPSQQDRGSNYWIRDLASSYDYCLIFPANEHGHFTHDGTLHIQTLRKYGFELFIYKNIKAKEEIFVLVRAPLEKLRAFADNIDYSMLLEEKMIEECMKAGNAEENIKPVEIVHRPEITHYRPYERIYGRYSRNVPETIYFHEEGEDNPFRELVKLKLTGMIMESRPADGSQNFKIQRYLKKKSLLGCFPLHNRMKTSIIQKHWEKYPRKSLPINEFKDYFGEKLGLYFSFLEHYSTFLWIPAIIGVPFQAAVYILNDYSAVFLPPFALIIALWSVCMLEYWKRKERKHALDWGTINFESTEVDRPDFRGERITSYIDGSSIKYYPYKKRQMHIYQSLLAISGLVLVVLGVIVSIYILRYGVVQYVGDSYAQSIASLANAIQIQVMNYVYNQLANMLSERENHRTATQFEDSMITKIFMFQFVNSFASFFFLAFVAKYIEGGCADGDCMKALSLNLAIIFGTRLVVGNLTEMLIPYLSYQFKYRSQILFHGGKMSRPEKEFLLERYDLMASSLTDYAEVAIQYGYMAMFITALPMAGIFAVISNIVEIRCDGWKLFNVHQRPLPKTAEDIGSWQMIFLLITIFSVITNAALTVFTMDTLNDLSDNLRFWIFVLFQWVCFSLQALVMALVPDMPEEIGIQLARTEFIVSKVINKVADDNTTDITGVDGPIEFQTYPLDEDGQVHEKH